MLRLLLVENFQDILNDYLFMFDKDYPYITDKELAFINNVQLGMKLFCVSIATEDNLNETANFFNKAYRTRNDTYDILRFISNFELELAYNLFYMLDMHNIQYRNIAKEKKNHIVELLSETLKLDDSNEILKFMYHTGVLVGELEKVLLEPLKIDEQLRTDYVDLINKLDKPTTVTINNLINMGNIYGYSQNILTKLYERRAFTTYIASCTRNNNNFSIEDERIEDLWPSYIKILKSETGYTNTKKKMSENIEFIEMLNIKRSYIGLPECSRIYFTKILQDKDILENIMTYDGDFIEQYLSEIIGFYDKEAAETFVKEISLSDELLKSQNVYDNTHQKLIDPVLKSKYTRVRNKTLE